MIKEVKIECNGCKQNLIKSDFYESSLKRKDYRCIKCSLLKSGKYQKENRVNVNASHRQYAKDNPEKTKAYSKNFRKRNQGRLVVEEKAKRLALRYEVLSFYSQNTMQCACCNESNIEFLAIDHINGGGNKHRKTVAGSHMYEWLKRNKFPEGFRVLCHNCNFSLGRYRHCPHNKYG